MNVNKVPLYIKNFLSTITEIKKIIKILLDSSHYKKLYIYIIVSAITYCIIFILLFLLIYFSGFDQVLSFCIVYTFSYIVSYIFNTKYVFKKSFSWNNILLFFLNSVFFMGVSTVFFSFLIGSHVNWFFSAILTSLTFLCFRFCFLKYFVYHDFENNKNTGFSNE